MTTFSVGFWRGGSCRITRIVDAVDEHQAVLEAVDNVPLEDSVDYAISVTPLPTVLVAA